MAVTVAASNEELSAAIRALLPTVNMETMGLKAFMKLVSTELGGDDLKSRKEYIKQTLTDLINKNEDGNDEDVDGDQDEDDGDEYEGDNGDEDDDEDTRGSSTTRMTSSGKGGGLSQQKEISPELARFLSRDECAMARTDIVKELWQYIRTHNLQNPSNKREILLDGPMKQVFGCDMFTMFTMNKYIGAHVHPFKPVDLTSSSSKKPATTSTTRKRGASTSRRKTGKGSSSSAKKPRKAGSQPPYRLSEDLQAVVGTDILPRPQVVSKIWTYIKANNLQNEHDKREILCDAKLKKIMKKDKISMFQMNVHIGSHLLEKLDRSEYQHGEGEHNDDNNDGDDASEDNDED